MIEWMRTVEGRRRGVALAIALVACAAAVAWYHSSRPGNANGVSGPAASAEATRHFFRGLAQLQVGQTDAAIAELAAAAELAPEEPAIWADLGLAQLRQGSPDDAATALAKAAALAPDSGEIAFLQARLATAQGRRDAAIAHLRHVIELDPSHLRAHAALVAEVESSGRPEADAEAARLLDSLLTHEPDNVALLVERARLAAKRGDAGALRDSLQKLSRAAPGWPPEVVEQYRAVQKAAAGDDAGSAVRPIAFLRNVLVGVPEYLAARSRVTPSEALVADPVRRFLRLAMPEGSPSPADEQLSYAAESMAEAPMGPVATLVAVQLADERPPAVFAADANAVRRADAAAAPLAFPGGEAGTPPTPHGLLALDWNHDFRLDLLAAGAGGVRLYLQSDDGSFENATDRTAAGGALDGPTTGAWAADLEMDGDLDVVVGVAAAPPVALRNNADGTWARRVPFPGVAGLRAFVWGDLDDDGDPDAALVDAAGGFHAFANLQGGRFERLPALADGSDLTDLALGDADGDGRLELLTLRPGRASRAVLSPSGWGEERWAQWEAPTGGTSGDSGRLRPAAARMVAADLDNNGALDLLVSGAAGTFVWLAGEDRVLRPLAAAIGGEVWDAVDLDGDGLLDLLGAVDGRPSRFLARGTRGYQAHVVRPRAVQTAGDQRINSFGIGGVLQARSGLLVQTRPITSPTVHFGLGERTAVDVTRIVWPNGVPQAEFDAAAGRPLVAEQRLKGSCPWVFADDDSGLRFVTDFLWRSPLGLRINAQDTAGIDQTEDWVRIRGDQLAARDGA